MIYFGEIMNFNFIVTFFLPLVAGLMYFFMAFQVKRTSKFRSIMFGEIGFRKLETAFILFGIYFITRPLQNILGSHPWPLIINCTRQFFLMAVISPSILVAIFHWVPTPSGAPRSSKFAAYTIGVLMGIIFALINSIAVTESKIISFWDNITIYDPIWFHSQSSIQLVLIHLICQFVSPVGFLLLAAAYVRHRRHTYHLTNIYNLIPTKWRYLEASLIIFASSFIIAGIAAISGSYYTYLWTIYFVGAIISGLFEMRSIKLPPRQAPNDLK
jgi:drug/metabolite transporter superfamily protein YnfA